MDSAVSITKLRAWRWRKQGLDGSLRPQEDWSMEVVDEFQNPLYTLRISAEKPK